MKFREIEAAELSGNVFNMIGNDWMLIGAEHEGRFNAMTASWGGMGILWGKPVATVFIRPQRYTYEFTEAQDKMTLSFFGGENMRNALKLCGTKSGRSCDKIAEAGLNPVSLHDGYTAFEEAAVIIECRKIYTDMIKPECMLDDSIMANYRAGDFHRMYICEIEKVLIK